MERNQKALDRFLKHTDRTYRAPKTRRTSTRLVPTTPVSKPKTKSVYFRSAEACFCGSKTKSTSHQQAGALLSQARRLSLRRQIQNQKQSGFAFGVQKLASAVLKQNQLRTSKLVHSFQKSSFAPAFSGGNCFKTSFNQSRPSILK